MLRTGGVRVPPGAFTATASPTATSRCVRSQAVAAHPVLRRLTLAVRVGFCLTLSSKTCC